MYQIIPLRFIIVIIFCSTIVICTFTAKKETSNVNGIKIISLNGRWKLFNQNQSIQIDGSVPGGVYSDLMQNKIIENIYKNYNDVKTRWVAKETWTYTSNFLISDDVLKKRYIFLIFHGVDTVARIFINNQEIGQTNNMFVRYRFNIRNYLKRGNNNISVSIKSPIVAANMYFEDETARRNGIPVQPLCTPAKYNGECHINHLRKQQASFAWDWGPAFPSSGIWKEVFIECYDTAIIRNIKVDIGKKPSNSWYLNITTMLESFALNNINGVLTATLYHYSNLSKPLEVSTKIKQFLVPENGEFEINQYLIVPENFVSLWWPNGHGNQTLYDLVLKFKSEEISQKNITVGFRTVELVQDKIKNHTGLTFYFKINDMPIFMKGSNWIPSNILPEISDTEEGKATIKTLLEAAKLANMNMLRVWGGGVYETDYFYTLTDKLGILIWQDFMFACAMYPASEDFLKNVKEEVTQQVNRLQHHPSIAIWAGNNENELALRQNWYNTNNHFKLFKQEYIQLYVDTIKTTVEKSDKLRPFIVSSPSNGKMSELEDYIAKHPGDPLYGDVHVYEYYKDSWKPGTYPNLRFSSEYGLQSLPNYKTLLEATDNPEEDLKRGSTFLKHRQHFPLDYIVMDLQIVMHFPTISKIDLKNYLFQSQIVQAMAMKTETEKYRQLRNTLYNNGEGLTMGGLYWQLNDVWQAPSWSSIDFAGRWKMLHYYARNFFSPVLVSGRIVNSSNLQIFVCSDLHEQISDAKLEIIVHNFDTFTNVFQDDKTVNIVPQTSLVYYENTLNNILNNTNKETAIVILRLYVNNSQLLNLSPENFILIGSINRVHKKPTHNCTVESGNDNQRIIKIATDTFSPFVWLQTEIVGYFSDNGFMMINPTKTIYFYTDSNVTNIDLQKSIHISSLRNTDQLM